MYTENFSITGATGTWIRQGKIRVIRYDSGAATGGVTPTIRVRSLLGSKFDVELTPGRTVTLTEGSDGLVVSNASAGADITGKLTFGDGTVADDAVVGSIDLNAATLAALEITNPRPESYTGSYASVAALAANTAEQVFSAAANPNGAVLLSAYLMGESNGNVCGHGGFIAKATAPGSLTDGVYAAMIRPFTYESGNLRYVWGVNDRQPFYIPAGLGLFIYCDTALTTRPRAATWKAL